ncbi:MAG TPA: hypothetical protein VHV26_06515 [Rhizomicrobium sp.]|jgi:hypothetical protein|nr:hypothetical protein [Rhizomicrobium sp.]
MEPRTRFASTAAWDPGPSAQERLSRLFQHYRSGVSACLEPLVRQYNPAMLAGAQAEYRKMLELSAKMNIVGHACTEIASRDYDARRQTIGSLFGACCFLADSFIDDFGEDATRDYLDRLEVLLTQGWFEPRTDREKLFFVILSRLFAERDILHPTMRQAVLQLYLAQKQDVELRITRIPPEGGLSRSRLAMLKRCARNRSGHAILVLSAFLLPDLPLAYLARMFGAGALVMYIDDHGDCYSDRGSHRITFMNQVRHPERTLKALFHSHVKQLALGLPPSQGRDLLIAFLTRYYLTRVEKHRQQKIKGGSAWAVYE